MADAHAVPRAVRLGDIVDRDFVSVSPDMPAAEALVLFSRYRLDVAPVVRRGRALGLVSRESLETVSGRSDSRIRDIEYLSYHALPSDTELTVAFAFASSVDAHLLFVADQGQLLGIVSMVRLEASIGDASAAGAGLARTSGEHQELSERASRARAAAALEAARCARVMSSITRSMAAAMATREAVQEVHEALHSSITRYARLLKLLESPAERTLRLVADVVESNTASIRPDERSVLLRDAVRWCEEAYSPGSSAA